MKYHIIGTYSTYYIIQDIMMVVFIRDLIVKRISIALRARKASLIAQWDQFAKIRQKLG